MARWWAAIFAVVCLCQTNLLVQGVKYFVTLPKTAIYDSQLLATVTAVGVPKGSKEYVSLSFKGAQDTSRILNSTTLEFATDSVQTWGVVFPWKRMQDLEEKGVRFVIGNPYGQSDTTIMFTQIKGYVFIQTDKPIYTPRQTVRFRIIAVDEYQLLSKYQIKVDIKNPSNVIVDRMFFSAEEAFSGKEFELPREATEGIWTISANEGLGNTYSARKTVQFEVKEYVLPRFSAELDIKTDVITRDTSWISMEVNAKYVYGQSVRGSAEIQLGVWDKYLGAELLPTKYSGELKHGKFYKDIRVAEVFSADNFPEDKRLYVAVNVTEAATSENFTIIDTSTVLAQPYYVVDFSPSDKYFKPGFPFTIKADVRSKSGRSTPHAHLLVRAFTTDKNNKVTRKQSYKTLDDSARLNFEINIPEGTKKFNTQVYVLDYERSTFNQFNREFKKFPSVTNEYIHISMISPIKKRRDGRVRLRYSKPKMGQYDMLFSNPTNITVQILSKGLAVLTTSTVKNFDGHSTIDLPRYLYKEASPSMRILAYYHAWAGEKSEFVVDSLLVDTEDVCLEELSLYRGDGSFGTEVLYKPKEEYKIRVKGGSHMKVGFVAVDEAVFLLNDKQSLTRDSLFAAMNSHDQGSGQGNGGTVEEVISNSGLVHLVYDTDEKKDDAMYQKLHEIHDPWVSRTSEPRSGKAPDLELNAVRSNEYERPQSIRNYFPEAWMFEEIDLPRSGRAVLTRPLPDSITTWNFMAVGLSKTRGVCVSKPLTQRVMKLFFADVRVPYKATRLEVVKVKVALYNYKNSPLKVNGFVTGGNGLCFSANSARGSSQDSFRFSLEVAGKSVASQVVKVIPLKVGDLTVRVDLKVENDRREADRDVVERNLHVVAEGLRVRKSITFVLDPEAKHVTYQTVKHHQVQQLKSATINNIFDLRKKEQNTTIDLALPKEVIRGTEFCQISAFGDLMGDIINHAVIESRSLVDQPMSDAEEVLGDFGPTVHALLYLNQSGLADERLGEKGRRFITHSVARLLKYRELDINLFGDMHFYKVTPKSQPATWLTAVVLKTLCYASKLAFVDKKALIDTSLQWLESRTEMTGEISGSVSELDWRLSKDTEQYQVMLSAEVLIALTECAQMDKDMYQTSEYADTLGVRSNDIRDIIALYLNRNLDMETFDDPMVLAKTTYALTIAASHWDVTKRAARSLWSVHKSNEQGHMYWSDQPLEASETTPFWYQTGAKASAIEATAYALMVFLESDEGVNVDAIADWLVGQRNKNGAFVGAMDSTVAIQALSKYSYQKQGLDVDLSCNVSSHKRSSEYRHSFKFTRQNATSNEAVKNVPLGHNLEVLTKGQGLGQMQVNVEYHIPIEKNAGCKFNVSVEVKPVQFRFSTDMTSNPLCSSCNIGCPKTAEEDNEEDRESSVEHRVNNGPRVFPAIRRPISRRSRTSSRRRRSLRKQAAASKRSICIHVCLQHLANDVSGPVSVELEMLTGYVPFEPDVKRLEETTGIRYVGTAGAGDVLVVQFNKVSHLEKTCFALRALDEEEVGRPTPATVLVKEAGQPQPSCTLEYNPVAGEESLQVFCASFDNSNRGECRCFSGICSACLPVRTQTPNLNEVKQQACRSPIAYEVELDNVVDQNQWVEIDATVISRNKTGSHDIQAGESIRLITPSSCHCPHYHYRNGKKDENDRVYLLSPDVEKLVDRTGESVYRYLLDEKSWFLRVSDVPQSSADRFHTPAIPSPFLQQGLRMDRNC